MPRPLTTKTSTLLFTCGCIALLLSANQTALPQDAQRAATVQVVREENAKNERARAIPPVKANKDDADARTPSPEPLKRRAGERVGSDPRGRALILGMAVQESPNGGVKVVEVAAASPAFEAGVQSGDEILSFAEFTGDSYRKWIDGIRRLATDAPDNSMLPVAVLRRGERLESQIRIPESTATTVRLPVIPPGQIGATQDQIAPVPIGGDNVAIAGAGAMGDFFGAASPSREHGIAQLVRLAGADSGDDSSVGNSAVRRPTNDPAQSQVDQRQNGARIGLAGFRDDPNGLLVMVDVGTLAPGNYQVAISDASLLGLQRNPLSDGAAPLPTEATPPRPPQPPVPPAPTTRPNADVSPPQSDLQPQSDDATAIPPTGQVNPLTTPPTGKVNPSTTTPTGQLTSNNALDAAAQPNAAISTNGEIGGGALGIPVGMLTVDQSGTGRLQQTVEGVLVRDVVGQAIVLYIQAASAPTTLPPNLDPTIDAAVGEGTVDRVQSPAAAARPSTNLNNAAMATRPDASATPLATASQAPVAGGIIRLFPDRRPEIANEPTTHVPPPANNSPPASPGLVR